MTSGEPATPPAAPAPWAVAAFVALVAGYLLAVHLLLVTAALPMLSLIVIVAPWLVGLVTGLWSADGPAPTAWRRPLAVALVVVCAGVAWRYGDRLAASADRVLYLENLLFLGTLAGGFAWTMRPGHEALVTRLARIARRGDMPEAVVRYTRAITVGWCVFFVGAALVSTALFVTQPRAVWSTYVNLVLAPSVAGVFVVEYLVRLRVLRGLRHESLMTGVMAFRHRDRVAAPVRGET